MNKWTAIDRVVVIGLGITGLSVIRHLLRREKTLDIRIIDTRAQPPGVEQLPHGVELCSGSWQMEWLLAADLIVASPGIALATPELQQAAQAGIPIVGDIELFAWACDKPVVGITGSNGKSTVTSLLGEMGKASGVSVGVGGNIGTPALDLLVQGHDVYILELSSFQLETTSTLALTAAAYLNLSEDHMDRYADFDAYANAKQRIFKHAALAVVNQKESATWPSNPLLPIRTFGFELSQYSVSMQDGCEWLMAHGKPVLACSEVALVGRHNVANCLAALALADAVGFSRAGAVRAMRHYGGLPHRCQLVAAGNGVRWVNDSKATNMASTQAALDGLVLDGHLHLLVGGDGKGADFSALAPILGRLDVTLYCYGRDADAFMPLTANSVQTETMDEAMALLSSRVQHGDMVLLSPACASLDQFGNFMLRGEHFTQLAKHYSGKTVSA
ncbi:UDP-N-acetylmuramoyl-L-alanine--D-glutamate ligase [Thaumasiovibrio sp. DFM-14]|uniref:UDP-N-acetylmuramoyl-L-alanine--D-glutamate ligase n=1 Tax=Thaumasiovibrio sp. DFM-14 TaxID=3384792 RepID=UPI0039A16A60